MKILAIIPARGGSKGILGKNIVPLCGKPLIAWSIEAVLASGHVNRVVVSTDDSAIAGVAVNYGAEVILRPAEISGDLASSEAALLHVLEHLQKTEGYRPDLIVFMQCTSPLTTTADIDGTIQKLLESGADTALAVIEFHYFLWRETGEGDFTGINHDKKVRPMRQEREPQYLETGAVYVMRTDGFLEAKHRFFGRTVVHVTPSENRLEIDDLHDLVIAAMMMQARMHRKRCIPPPACSPFPPEAVVFDFDGVFTDNKVYVDQDGVEMVRCDRGDGWGLARLAEAGVRIAVLSSEKNPVVGARCRKLNLECIQNLGTGKDAAFQEWCRRNNINPGNIIYVGNDENDLGCLAQAGFGLVPADAHETAKHVASHILHLRGGEGAVREVCDMILLSMGTQPV